MDGLTGRFLFTPKTLFAGGIIMTIVSTVMLSLPYKPVFSHLP